MIFQICLFTESSMAHVTLEWPGSGVNIRVRFEIAWSWKGFWTHCAFMWFFLQKEIKKIITYLSYFIFQALKGGRVTLDNKSQLSHVFNNFLTHIYSKHIMLPTSLTECRQTHFNISWSLWQPHCIEQTRELGLTPLY